VNAVDTPVEAPPVDAADAHSPIAGYMFDVDGTLLLSDRSLGGYDVLPGAVEVLATLQERSIPFALLTNGSAYPPHEQAARLRKIGLPIEDSQMLTPSSVAADHLSRMGVKRVLVLGTRGVGYALQQAGIETVYTGEPGATEVDAVYVGWHPECGMKDIESACNAIWNGAKLFTASDVPFFATKSGRSMGYSYAIIGAIRRMTKVTATITGKPSLRALRYVAKQIRVPARNLCVVGDDPLVEGLMARRGGATLFGVTTGVTSKEAWMRQPEASRPHRVLADLREILES
jgi:4-nitrophenyl phosphatase